MVSSTVPEDGAVVPKIEVSPAPGAPAGDYRLVGWDMDATGKRLVDEICQIAGYTTGSAYSQYVMPFRNLSPPAKKRHGIKIVTMGRYRVLKNSFTNEVEPTKSEIWALTDFLGWLEKVKGDAADGVILVHHEPRKVIPSMLIEALTKYNLLERFKNTVKGFANGYDVAEIKCGNTLKVFSLRTLSRVLLDQEEKLNSAVNRARLALQIVQHLSVGEENGNAGEEVGSGDSDAAAKATIELVREFVQPVSVEEKEHAALKVVLLIQNTLKPIFHPLLSMVRRERQHASRLRRLLAESGIDYSQSQEAWNNGKREGLEKLVKAKVTGEDKDLDNLVEILDTHFDPEKSPPVPAEEEKKKFRKAKRQKRKTIKLKETENVKSENKENNNVKSENKENNNVKMEKKEDVKNKSVSATPDTTTSDSPVKDDPNDTSITTTMEKLSLQS